jgi:hypothetical protein
MNLFTLLKLQYIRDGRWIVLEDFKYAPGEGLPTVVVPAGFTTDMDSVPRIPLIYAAFKGRAVNSAVIHDLLYEQGKGKVVADRTFLAAMKHEGVPLWHRWPIYLAVATFGWAIYREKSGC